jgi:hypothetical protein
VVLILLPILFAVVFAVLAMTALAPKAPAPPAMAAGDAVKLISFDGSRSTLYCVNPMWGDEFARANGVQPVQKSRSAFFGANCLLVALVFAPILAGGTWFLAHPQVHVDNAGAEALQIWVDGKPRTIVEANKTGGVPPSFFIAHGKHTFGYSKVGATQPEATVEKDATMVDAHLYNPAKTGCYWLVADSYGSASTAGISQGPQPIQEFYSFDKVDTWFGDNPQSVEVQNGQSGDTRVALQRAKECMFLADKGCDESTREQFVTCQRAAGSEEASKRCTDGLTCLGGAKPAPGTAPSPHAGPHPSAHTPPHTAPHPSAAHSGK